MNQLFKHYKGHYYRVLHIADHAETREKIVIYEQLVDNDYPKGYVWACPLDMFNEQIVYNQKIVHRFELVQDGS